MLALLCVSLPAAAGSLLVVGDSISAGYGMPPDKVWVKLLESRIAKKGYPHTVVNASVSGDTTAGGLSRLPALLRQHRPAVVLLELGGNDGLRGLPVKATRGNLTEMANMARKSGARVLVLGIDIPPNYGPKYAKEFSGLYAGVAKATGATLVPAFLAKVAVDPDMMQSDGIHPNSLAQPVLVDTVWPALEPMLQATR